MKVIITIDYQAHGPAKNIDTLSKKFLNKKNNYENIIEPYDFDKNFLDIDIFNNQINIIIDNLQIKDKNNLKKTIINNFNDSWGEGLFEFGKEYFYYAEDQKIIEGEDIKNIEKFQKSYYILDSIELPKNSKYETKNCQEIKSKKPLYFYKDINFNKYQEDYYLTTNNLPEIFKNILKIENNQFEYILPKNLHEDIIETNNYIICYSPDKYSRQTVFEKKKDISDIFYRKDNSKGYHLNQKIVYKGKLNRIEFDNIRVKIL